MKGIEERIAEKYPNHSQLEWDVLNGIVAIAKGYAIDVARTTLNRAFEGCVTKIPTVHPDGREDLMPELRIEEGKVLAVPFTEIIAP